MSNGAKPAGIRLSLNPPGNLTRLKRPLNTSILALLKLAAYRNECPPTDASARPLYTECLLANSTCAFEPETGCPAHALSTPDSESKRKSAGPLPVGVCTTKSLVELNTVPVGAPCGMLTTSGTIAGMLPSTPPLYRVETSAPLSATHSGEVGLADCPHGLTRLGSVIRATPGMSEMRFVCWYRGGSAAVATGITTAAAAAAAANPPLHQRRLLRPRHPAPTPTREIGEPKVLPPLRATELARGRADPAPATTTS